MYVNGQSTKKRTAKQTRHMINPNVTYIYISNFLKIGIPNSI